MALDQLMAKRPTTPAGASDREAPAADVGQATLAESIQWECERATIPFTPDGIAAAFADAEIDDAPSVDAITDHIRGATKLTPGAKGLNRKTLNAYARLFKLKNPDSLQRPSHIGDRMRELARPAVDLAKRAMSARNADLGMAKQRLETLWGGPHQSLAFLVLDYLAEE